MKKLSIFPTNSNFERFENSYYLNRIQRKICHNLVKKNQIQKRERTSFNVRERNWQTSGNKNAPIREDDFAPIFLKKTQTKNTVWVDQFAPIWLKWRKILNQPLPSLPMKYLLYVARKTMETLKVPAEYLGRIAAANRQKNNAKKFKLHHILANIKKGTWVSALDNNR